MPKALSAENTRWQSTNCPLSENKPTTMVVLEAELLVIILHRVGSFKNFSSICWLKLPMKSIQASITKDGKSSIKIDCILLGMLFPIQHISFLNHYLFKQRQCSSSMVLESSRSVIPQSPRCWWDKKFPNTIYVKPFQDMKLLYMIWQYLEAPSKKIKDFLIWKPWTRN